METMRTALLWVVCIVLYVAFLLWLGKMVQMLSPSFTTLFVLGGTVYGLMVGRFRALLTITGIALYVLSFVAFERWGWSVWEAQALFGAGIISWIVGVFVPAANHLFPLIFNARRRLA